MPEPSKKFVRSDNAPTYYVNNVELRSTQFDFRFSMGEVVGIEGDAITIKQLADVYMSPQHAKVFLRLLNDQVRKYEEKLGPIALLDEKKD